MSCKTFRARCAIPSLPLPLRINFKVRIWRFKFATRSRFSAVQNSCSRSKDWCQRTGGHYTTLFIRF